jgi:hypothetical protein
MKIIQGFYYKNKLKVTLRSAFNEFPLKVPSNTEVLRVS